MILKFKVSEQTISALNTKYVPRIGSKDYLVFQFSFSSDWEGLTKIAYLQRDSVSVPIEIKDGLVEVPEWFTEQESFNVTLFGTDGTKEVPTNIVAIKLEKSNDLWVKDAPEPTPSWITELVDLSNHPPIPGSNGFWLLWDADKDEYVESQLPLPEATTSDHSKLTNRDAADQHPMSAITGLVGALGGKVSVADIINNLTTNASNKPLSAAQGVALKELIDAISIPEKLPNPHALTFTGAVTGSYDGSEAKTINIPSGGASGDYIPVPATAKVGQTIVVKAVDETGKPTEWEAADMANGGGDEALPMLYHGTIEEAITNAEFTEIDGNPISLSEVKVWACFKSSQAAWCGIVIATNAVNPNNKTIQAGAGSTYTKAEQLYVSFVDAKISDGNFELSGINPVAFTAYYNESYTLSSASYLKSIPNITYSSPPELQEKNAYNGKINKIKIDGSFSKLEVIIWGR